MTYQTILAKAFQNKFGTQPDLIVRAPGRVNLLGEHTDYNGGFVLPAAIDKAIYFCISKRSDSKIVLHANDLNEELEIKLDALAKSSVSWANFLIGVASVMATKGANLSSGFNLSFGGDVPLGAGLSSSAAVESGFGTALNELFELNFSKKDLVLIAQQAEHEFAGVKCGIMDMYASIFGKSDSLIKLDCKEVEHTYLPFKLADHTVVLFNTGVKHNLGDSEYNKRRAECEEGLGILKKHQPLLETLRDANRKLLESHKSEMSPVVYKRCSYIVGETERMQKATVLLDEGNIVAFGELMFLTHLGLQHDYEVSCKELDFLVDFVKGKPGVLGSRMMGGGFGGCTINIIANEHLEAITTELKKAYQSAFNIEMENYLVTITNGCEIVQ